MDHPIDKNLYIYLVVCFVIGLLIGATFVLLFYPQKECKCDVVESVDKTLEELSENVKSEESSTVEKNDTLSIDVSLPVPQCSVTVDIAGAVLHPGVYCLQEGSNIVDVVNLAKGFIEGVAHKFVSMKINLSSPITNHQKIYIPFEEDVYCELKSLQYIDSAENESTNIQNDDINNDDTPTCININTATKAQLTELDGVGDSTAQKIIDGRPYTQITDILNVSGIGQTTYDKFKDDICIY